MCRKYKTGLLQLFLVEQWRGPIDTLIHCMYALDVWYGLSYISWSTPAPRTTTTSNFFHSKLEAALLPMWFVRQCCHSLQNVSIIDTCNPQHASLSTLKQARKSSIFCPIHPCDGRMEGLSTIWRWQRAGTRCTAGMCPINNPGCELGAVFAIVSYSCRCTSKRNDVWWLVRWHASNGNAMDCVFDSTVHFSSWRILHHGVVQPISYFSRFIHGMFVVCMRCIFLSIHKICWTYQIIVLPKVNHSKAYTAAALVRNDWVLFW